MNPTLATVQADAPAAQSGQPRVLSLVFLMFFAWGFCTVLVDTLIPKLKAVFALSYVEVMLTQFCFFLAYFVISLPAGWLLGRLGYLRTIMTGLLIMAGGCMLFTPAAALGVYPAFLGALFILATGITIVQVAANPLAAMLGNPLRAHARLTLAQGFNSVGTMLAPLFGSALILAGGVALADPGSLSAVALSALRGHEAHVFQLPFTLVAVVLGALALLCWIVKRAPAPAAAPASTEAYRRVLRHPRLSLGALSIFLYVGAEVSIGSAMVNFLMAGSSLDAHHAGKLVSVYWGLAMLGRFIGARLLRHMPAAALLGSCAMIAALMVSGSTMFTGTTAAVMVLAIGLFNSVMFPNIFSLAIEGLGEQAASGSGVLCLAIVGGAIVPLIFGYVADHAGLVSAYFVPAVCYLWIAAYGLMLGKGPLRLRTAQ
ncbi:sugar MFS transporter [Solimonas terrae]|uniref:Sugar MFS transporter n=1 Tax=Solimonas terrae TaxID=1396819 RepID=A0A6M2BMD3_9GAMM|nr:sugar MFS transporter [Solimonas terrae]NGY03163.1 sugar MFS transporter [Solimonas terrae]